MARKPSLTPEQVISIRNDTRTLKDLAAFWGVSLLTVWKAKNGKPPYHDKEEAFIAEQRKDLDEETYKGIIQA